MANLVKKGFIPLDFTKCKANPYTVASGYAPANSQVGIAPGEVVTRVTAGTLEVCAAGSAALILGVVASVSYLDSTGRRITAGYLPTGYTFTGDPSITNPRAPIIYVWDDPDVEYVATVATATTQALVAAGGEANMDLSATSSTSVDTVYNRSLRTLDGTFVAGTAQFRVLKEFREPGHAVTAANWRAICKINEGIRPSLSTAGI